MACPLVALVIVSSLHHSCTAAQWLLLVADVSHAFMGCMCRATTSHHTSYSILVAAEYKYSSKKANHNNLRHDEVLTYFCGDSVCGGDDVRLGRLSG